MFANKNTCTETVVEKQGSELIKGGGGTFPCCLSKSDYRIDRLEGKEIGGEER